MFSLSEGLGLTLVGGTKVPQAAQHAQIKIKIIFKKVFQNYTGIWSSRKSNLYLSTSLLSAIWLFGKLLTTKYLFTKNKAKE